MTRQEYNILAKYEHQYSTAINEGYVRGITETLVREVKPIYDRETGNNQKVFLGCSHCVLQFIRKVGLFYFSIVEDEIELTPIEKARLAKKNKQATNKK